MGIFDLEFSVSDLAMKVRQQLRFNADLRFFDNDGSFLVVSPEPPFPWSENYAQPVGRFYDELDRQEAADA